MSNSSPDPYRVLGVGKSSSAADIKKKYRKLARELHPDRGGDPEKLKSVNAAYEILGDADKRKLFDEFGHTAFRPGFDPDLARRFQQFGGGRGASAGSGGAFGNIDLEEILKMFGGGGAPQGESFGSSFGFGGPRSGRGRGRGPRRGQDRQLALTVSLSEALQGSERRLQVDGKAVTVRVPKGVRSGQRLRVAGKGLPGVSGGPSGDLFLEIEVAAHPLVRVDRDDLEMDLPITFGESVRGGSIEVSTPTGTVKVKLPARAEAGTRLRLKGRGLPKGGKGTRTGDLYLVLMPTPPHKGGKGVEKTLAELDKAYTSDVRSELKFD